MSVHPEIYRMSDGSWVWMLNNRFHREDGPAREYPNGDVEWWLEGDIYHFSRWINKSRISDEEKVMLKLIYG
jgi:hypothetical protein